MYARVVSLRFKPGMSGEAVRIAEESIVPAAKAQKGFRGIYLLISDEDDTGKFVSFWESEADLRANEGSGFYQEQMAKLGRVFAAPPSREVLKVGVYDSK